MKIVNDATPPIPLHALEEYLYEMKQRGSVLDLAGKHGWFFKISHFTETLFFNYGVKKRIVYYSLPNDTPV